MKFNARIIVLMSLYAAVLAIGCQKNIGLLEPHIYNAKELKKDLDCYINKGPCVKINASCKRRMPQDVTNACNKCNYRQKHHLRLFIERSRELFPEEFIEFRSKYDPKGKHFFNLERALMKY